jgi:putative ABC transport system permease protein
MKLLAWFGRRRRREQDLDEEIRAHMAIAIRERIEQGESPAEAEANARREFGNATLVKEVTRDMWGWRWLETLLQDIRYGLRQLRRNPGFTAVAVITLALGIGANTAVFTLVNGLLLRDLPVRQPDRLVELWADRQNHEVPFSYLMFRELVRGQHVFSGLIGWSRSVISSVQVNGLLSLAGVSTVTENYYTILWVTPLAGRLITPEHGSPFGGNTAPVDRAAARMTSSFWPTPPPGSR